MEGNMKYTRETIKEDIYELIYDSCSKLGIEDEKLDFNSIHLNTIGDVIDVIWKAETK